MSAQEGEMTEDLLDSQERVLSTSFHSMEN